MGFGLGSIISGVIGSNQNPFNSGFGSLTGGIFPAGINQLGDNFINGYMNYYFSNKLANKQNQRMIDFWNMQNAYNTPAAQMQRFKEAGLNPNLIYGQTNIASPIGTPAVGSFHMPDNQVRTSGFDLMSALQAYYGIKNIQQQNKNLQSQDTLLGSQADFVSAQADRYRYDTEWLKEHGISSFSHPTERLGSSVLGFVPMEQFSRGLGTVVGNLQNEVPHVIIRAKDFRTRAELEVVKDELSKRNILYSVDRN